MGEGPEGMEPRDEDLEAPLLAIDSELNVFALANGLDFWRNTSDTTDRTLEWYRDGMERRIVIRGRAGGGVSVTVGASRGGADAGHTAPLPLADLDRAGLRRDLRRLLEEGIERANALGESDLLPPD